VGHGVAHIGPGDLVISLQGANWVQRRRLRADDVIPVPPGTDPQQAAMLRINPPTALLLLTDVVALNPGDWILQNAANAAVGRMIIRLAKARGLRTVNLVRREVVCGELLGMGADACLVDAPGLPEQVRAVVGGATVRLALDGVGGDATGRLASCVADGGTVCTYGALGGDAVAVGYPDLIFRGVGLVGFWLTRALAGRPSAEVMALYADLATRLRDGTLAVPVEAVYPIEEIRAALEHAQRPGRGGKILIAPNTVHAHPG
jgi:NADPH:quinone reductase-like Zn-dependent oxidoreductase